MELWVILTISSAILFAIKDILAKKILNANVKPNQILFEQNLLIILIILIIFFPKIQIFHFDDLLIWYIIKSFSVTISMLFYFQLLKKYEISHITPLLNLSPIILLFLSSLFLGEVISVIQFIGILIIIISTYFIEITIKHHEEKKPHLFHLDFLKKLKFNYFLKVFIMIFFISMAAISDKFLLKEINVYTNMFFTALIVFSLMLIYYLKTNKIKERFKLLIHEPETLVISLFSILSNFLVILAISIPTALVSLIVPLRRTSTLFSAILGGILFHEKHLIKKIISVIFMLIGVILIVI